MSNCGTSWIFLDTCACSKIADSENRHQIVERLREKFQIAVSPHTTLELLHALGGSNAAYFQKHKSRFNAAQSLSQLREARVPQLISSRTGGLDFSEVEYDVELGK